MYSPFFTTSGNTHFANKLNLFQNKQKMSEKFTNELTLILKKYIPNIDLQNPIIKYQIDKLSIEIYDFYDLLIPLKSIFQINKCKNNFIECLKEIYSLHLKYSEILDETSKCIEIDLSAALSIPQIESLIINFISFR